MYCRDCGARIPEGAKYCPSCGADQDAHSSRPHGIAAPWIILALLLLPPLGLVLLFTSSRLSSDTKWILGGFFFAPFWARFLWRQRWSPPVKLALLAGLTAVYFLVQVAFIHLTAAIWVTVLSVIALLFIIRSRGAQPFVDDDAITGNVSLRGIVQSKLDRCNDVIAQIETHTVFDFAPMNSPERQRYLAALELRAEATDLYEHAGSRPDLVMADGRATQALKALKSAQDELWAMRDDGDTRLPS